MLFLTEDELRELTGRERRPAQVRQLNALGIEFRQRADRSIVVLRAHVEQVLGITQPKPPTKREPQINWDPLPTSAKPAARRVATKAEQRRKEAKERAIAAGQRKR